MASLKHLSFIMLVLQNTALGIVSKLSRHATGPKYNPGTVILLVELLKFVLCYLVLLKTKQGDVVASMRTLRFEVFADMQGLKKMIILAALYAFQNIMALFAYDYVDVATYQIVYQLKIITTAMFMIVLLNRRFSIVQWGAMLTLMVGVAICSYSRLPANTSTEKRETDGKWFIGVSIVLGLAVNSGLAAAYFERVMKSHKSNATMQTLDPLWVRNLQLSAISMAVTLFDLFRNSGDIWANGFFHGFHPMVFGVIFLQAVGGLTIAAVVRYSDNVVKNFGTSFSLVFSCIISNYMFDQTATAMFYLGVLLVVVSVFIYGDQRFAPKPVSKPKVEAVKPNMAQSHEIDIEMRPGKNETASGRHFTSRAIASFSVLSI
ncbi:TPA: hypothetical protein N0F65_005438 [Lagenidium giganteum]|uniref:UDP-N-acetylglucosamine transporter n=1 Tax=Lagenidium giganteum TaxID=4803 RepID=A0AAV2YYP2_9STRA|nr:TPA: hypothetical protein N0F65_005438 [Lagenidium giganteum]